MAATNTARETLDGCFLEVRSRILDIAAGLDRIDRGADADAVRQDQRLQRLHQAIAVLADGAPDRAERVQQAFSLPYDPNWRG